MCACVRVCVCVCQCVCVCVCQCVWVLWSVRCSLIHCWQFWPDFFSVCARLGVNYWSCLARKTNHSELAGFWNFAREHGFIHPHNLSRHAAVHTFPAFPTLKTSWFSPVGLAIPHDHNFCELAADLSVLTWTVLTFDLSSSPAPMFFNWCHLWVYLT